VKIQFQLGMIIFGSVRFLPKKNNKTNFFKKKTEIDSNRPVSVRFGYFRAKTEIQPINSVFSGFFYLT
jgi:hypothetical protein